jgi:hypothetical protein
MIRRIWPDVFLSHDDFWKTFPEAPVVVDTRKAKILEGERSEFG